MKNICLLLLPVTFLFNSCKKEEPCNHPDEHYKIDSVEAKKIPYTGTDTLRFYYHDSEGSDTITYIGQGRQYEEVRWDRLGNPEEGCMWWGWAEQYTIQYKAEKPGFDLEFKNVQQGGGGHFYITLLNQTADDLLWVVNNSSYDGFYDEKEVNGKLYCSVNYFPNRGASKTFNLYYTTDHGIIRMELSNNKVWELLD